MEGLMMSHSKKKVFSFFSSITDGGRIIVVVSEKDKQNKQMDYINRLLDF